MELEDGTPPDDVKCENRSTKNSEHFPSDVNEHFASDVNINEVMVHVQLPKENEGMSSNITHSTEMEDTKRSPHSNGLGDASMGQSKDSPNSSDLSDTSMGQEKAVNISSETGYTTCSSEMEESREMEHGEDNEPTLCDSGTGRNLMPTEQLDSDDSDTAGYYQVNNPSDPLDSDNEQNIPIYQRGVPLTSSSGEEVDSDSDSSDDDDVIGGYSSQPSRFSTTAHQWLVTGSRSSSISSHASNTEETTADSSEDEGEQVTVEPKVKVVHSILSRTQSRQLGDFGRQRNHLLYTKDLRGNLNFVKKMRCIGTLDSHGGCVNALNFNQSGTYLASGSDDLKVIIWDMHSYTPYITFNSGHTSNVFQSKFMPHSNDSQVVTCARDGQVRLAELSVTGSCRETKRIGLHSGSAHKLAVEKDPEHCLLSAGEDGVVFQMDLRVKKPKRLVQVFEERRKVALYSIDKNPSKPFEFIVSGRDHFIRVYDKRYISSEERADTAIKKLVPPSFAEDNSGQRDVTCAVYNCNGSEILGTYNDDDIYLFNNEVPVDDAFISSYTGHRNSSTVKGVNFYGPRSEYIVSGSDCGHVFIWDKLSSEPLQIRIGDEGGVVNVLEPHPHLPYLAISGLDDSIKVFMPMGKKASSMAKYKKLMRRNVGKRSSFNSNVFFDSVDRPFFLAAMRRIHLQRLRREAGEEEDDSSDEEDDVMQCPVS